MALLPLDWFWALGRRGLGSRPWSKRSCWVEAGPSTGWGSGGGVDSRLAKVKAWGPPPIINTSIILTCNTWTHRHTDTGTHTHAHTHTHTLTNTHTHTHTRKHTHTHTHSHKHTHGHTHTCTHTTHKHMCIYISISISVASGPYKL